MTVLPEQTEVILEVAGEGGGYTIMGKQQDGQWLFWRDGRDSDAWMYDEFDEEAPASTSKETAAEPAVCHYKTLGKALEQINSDWPNLHPIRVHPHFSKDIWRRVVRHFRDNKENQAHRVLSKWSEICLGRKLTSLDELNSSP